MDNDYDLKDFNSNGNFVKKEDLAESGPQRKRITAVEKRDSRLDAQGRATPELVLVFSDGMRFGLRARCNRDVLGAALGTHTRTWIGKCVELFIDPTVRNPNGARVGGTRLRVLAEVSGPEEYVSDLELEDEADAGEDEDAVLPPAAAAKARR